MTDIADPARHIDVLTTELANSRMRGRALAEENQRLLRHVSELSVQRTVLRDACELAKGRLSDRPLASRTPEERLQELEDWLDDDALPALRYALEGTSHDVARAPEPIKDPHTDRTWPSAEHLYRDTLKHIIRRIREDPDVHFLFGPCTESFELLVLCLSAIDVAPLDNARKYVGADAQPEYRRREPEVLELREKLRACRDKLEELGELDHP
jgi:hypothetical protein